MLRPIQCFKFGFLISQLSNYFSIIKGLILSFYIVKDIVLCKGNDTNAWGLGGLVNAHSKLL